MVPQRGFLMLRQVPSTRGCRAWKEAMPQFRSPWHPHGFHLAASRDRSSSERSEQGRCGPVLHS